MFPQMTVEENLLMGGYLLPTPADARRAAEAVFERYPRLKQRRSQRAGVLSGGELLRNPDVGRLFLGG